MEVCAGWAVSIIVCCLSAVGRAQAQLVMPTMTGKRQQANEGSSKSQSNKKMKSGAEPGGSMHANLVHYKHAKNNVLERITAHPDEAWVIFDGQHTLSALSSQPRSSGHAIVVCKEPIATVLDSISQPALLAMAKDVQALSRAMHLVKQCQGGLTPMSCAHHHAASHAMHQMHCACHQPVYYLSFYCP